MRKDVHPGINTIFQLIQATSEHQSQVRELFSEYLQFLSETELRTFGKGFDVESVVHSDMQEWEKLSPPQGRLLLVMGKDAVAGLGGFRTIRPRVAEVKRFYIRPEFRRQGLARTLIKQLIEEALAMGFHTLMLDAAPYSQAAKSLYRSEGFVSCELYSESEAPKDFLKDWEFMRLELCSRT